MFILVGFIMAIMIFNIFYRVFIMKLQLKKLEAAVLASGITGLIVKFFSLIPSVLMGEYVYLMMCIPYLIFIPLVLFITYKRKGNISSGFALSVFLSLLSSIVGSLLWDLFK